MIEVIIYNFITTIIFYSSGHFFAHYITNLKNKNSSNLNIYLIYGVFFIGIISLLINFFFPLNLFINTTLALLFLGYFFLKVIYKQKYWKRIIYFLIIFSFICSLLIIYSTVNRPDAGLYHLPFTKILNEYKIIFGLSNIHFRFGHTSISQYSNAFNFNYILREKGILIPQTIIIVSVIIYFFQDLLKLEKLGKTNLSTVVLFFCIIFSIYTYNRYSSFGNDAAGNILFIFLIYKASKLLSKININLNDILNLSYISLFCFLQKPFLIFSFLVPILFFLLLYKKNKWLIFKNKNIYLLKLFFLFFLLKNIIISGCLIYPAEVTCIKSLDWYNNVSTQNEAIMAEAWAKDWINLQKNKYEPNEYISDFKWIETWKDNHLKIVIEKYFPYLAFVSIFSTYIFLISKKRDYLFSQNEKKILLILFLTTFLSVIMWFLKFPLYRYGSGIIGGFTIVCFILLLNKIIIFPSEKLYKIFKNIILIFFFIIFCKNLIRVYENIDHDNKKNYWPNIYSLSKNGDITEYKEYKSGEKFMFFVANDGLCMYGPAPCSYYVDKRIDKRDYYGYELYFIKKKYD